MTYAEALRMLRTGGDWTVLAQAIGVVISSTQGSTFDLLFGLKHGGLIAEQAALALYRKTGRAIPEDRSRLVTDVPTWTDWIVSDRLGGLADADREKQSAAAPANRLFDHLTRFIAHELTQDERTVIVLFYLENRSFDEIAALLDLNISEVSRINRDIMDRMKRHLAEDVQPLSRLLQDLVA